MVQHVGAAMICLLDIDLILHNFQGAEVEWVQSCTPNIFSRPNDIPSTRNSIACEYDVYMEQSQNSAYLRFQSTAIIAEVTFCR